MKRWALVLISLFCLIVPTLCASVSVAEPADCSVWNGSSEDPEWVASGGGYYRIGSAAQFAGMRDWVNDGKSADKKYIQATDIDLSGIEWEPIGKSNGAPFKGHFDGGGHVIANLSVADPLTPDGLANYAGLFGRVAGEVANDATLHNVRILSADISVTRTTKSLTWYVGALAGDLYNSRAESCQAQGVSISADSDENLYVGGLFGRTDGMDTDYSSVERCLVVARLRQSGKLGVTAGGVIGFAQRTQIHEIAARVDMRPVRPTSNNNIFSTGGLLGKLDKSTVRDSVSYGKIILSGTNSNNYTGGVAGHSVQAYGNNSIETCASFVDLPSDATITGGILGFLNNSSLTVKSCDWLYTNSEVEAGIGGDATQSIVQQEHARSLDREAFKDEGYFRERGWDFDDAWCYTPLDGRAAPNLAFIFTDPARETVSPDLLHLLPGSLAIEADGHALVKIFSGVHEIDDLTFDGAIRLSSGGLAVERHPASRDWFVVSTDGYVVGGERDITVSVAIGDTVQAKIFRLSVSGDLEISTDALPMAECGVPYYATIETKNAHGAATFTPIGIMPPGLNLDADTGVIYGTPTSAGSFDLAIAATDARHTVRKTFALAVEAAEASGTDKTDETGESLTNLLSELNAALGGARIGVVQLFDGEGTPISSLSSTDISLEPRRGADIGGDYIALADSFSISVALNELTQGDCLALSYAVDLTSAEGFADWPDLDVEDRVQRLDEADVAAIYEFADTATFATLVGDGGLCSWQDALLTGRARITADGVAVNYVVTDEDGAPRLDGNAVVIPDGARDGRIEDPVWVVRTTQETATAVSGGGGCATGITPVHLFAAALPLAFRKKRKKTS